MADRTETIKIQGMSCGHCVAAVRSVLDDLPGVQVEDVAMGSAQIRYDPSTITHEQINDAIDAEGYAVIEFVDVQ